MLQARRRAQSALSLPLRSSSPSLRRVIQPIPVIPNDRFDDTIEVRQHFGIPKSKDLKPLRFQPILPLRIRIYLKRVDVAIKLDDQPHRGTKEIDSVWSQGHLTPKLQTRERPRPQRLPKHRPCLGRLAAQGASQLGLLLNLGQSSPLLVNPNPIHLEPTREGQGRWIPSRGPDRQVHQDEMRLMERVRPVRVDRLRQIRLVQ